MPLDAFVRVLAAQGPIRLAREDLVSITKGFPLKYGALLAVIPERGLEPIPMSNAMDGVLTFPYRSMGNRVFVGALRPHPTLPIIDH